VSLQRLDANSPIRDSVTRMSFMRALRLTATCGLALTLPAARAAANLIVNGSFESPTAPAGGFSNFAGGSTAISGWTVVGVDSAVVNKTFTQSGIVFQSEDGNQWLDLSGVTSNSTASGVTQSVPTAIGTAYQLSFYVGSATDGSLFFPATVDLSIDGGARVSYTNPTAPATRLDWKLFTVGFTATKSVTNLTFFNAGAANNYLAALDNVSLDPAPTPVPALGPLPRIALAGVLLLVALAFSRSKGQSLADSARRQCGGSRCATHVRSV
jgi:hypothetical protein